MTIPNPIPLQTIYIAQTNMPSRRNKAAQKFRGAQKWIMAEVNALRPTESLSTSQIAKRIKKASGKDFHKNSVYLALRKLVNRGSLLAVRKGQEKTYKLSKSGASSPAPTSTAVPTRAAPVSPAAMASDVELTGIPATSAAASSLPHKLALGEILVLELSDGKVLTATNLHGRLVMEWQPVP